MPVVLRSIPFWSFAIGLPSTIILILLAPYLFLLLSDDPAVREMGTPYLQMRMVGMIFIGMNFAYRGFWNGIGRSAVYMRTIIFIHVAQIAIAWPMSYGSANEIPGSSNS